ncbi:MAG: putative sugar O-methyltransferase [Anaerolinea sp.]|nr:putative sugar O-methyltransferase [Anaerolinea sp.]
MEKDRLTNLLQAYRNASQEFHATSYWAAYEEQIMETIKSIDLNQLRSGKYPYLATFGFNDVIYFYHPNLPFPRKVILKLFHKYVLKNRRILPYGINVSDIRDLSYQHCNLLGKLSNAEPISSIEVSTFGNPKDLFEVNGKKYTMPFLNYYARYCFANKHVAFKDKEIVVELGSGSGYQIEVLKKLHPHITVLCFDLPAQIYLCESYLSQALGKENIVGTEETLMWKNLSNLQKGRVHCFGNWQIPLIKELKFDVFWNAASFGEMEPNIVANYLSYIEGNVQWIYLLQARHGKEISGKAHVAKQTTFDNYVSMLPDFNLWEEHDAWQAYKKLSEAGGYFEAIWKNKFDVKIGREDKNSYKRSDR